MSQWWIQDFLLFLKIFVENCIKLNKLDRGRERGGEGWWAVPVGSDTVFCGRTLFAEQCFLSGYLKIIISGD